MNKQFRFKKQGIQKFVRNKEVYYSLTTNSNTKYFNKQNNLKLELNKVNDVNYINSYEYSGCVVILFSQNNNDKIVFALPIPCEIYDDTNKGKKFMQYIEKTKDIKFNNACAKIVFLASTCGTQLKERDSLIKIVKNQYKAYPWFNNTEIYKKSNDEFIQYLNEKTLELKECFNHNKPFQFFNIVEGNISSNNVTSIKYNKNEVEETLKYLSEFYKIRKLDKDDNITQQQLNDNNYNFKLVAFAEAESKYREELSREGWDYLYVAIDEEGKSIMLEVSNIGNSNAVSCNSISIEEIKRNIIKKPSNISLPKDIKHITYLKNHYFITKDSSDYIIYIVENIDGEGEFGVFKIIIPQEFTVDSSFMDDGGNDKISMKSVIEYCKEGCNGEIYGSKEGYLLEKNLIDHTVIQEEVESLQEALEIVKNHIK